MISKHNDLVGSLIHDVAHHLRLDIDRRLEPHNLTRVKWLALGVLKRNGSSTQAQLAAEMELGNATVGRLVDRLEERGFVKRIQDPNDRRSYQVSLTKAATEQVGELDSIASNFRDNALETLSKTEISALNKGLIKIKENLKATAATLSAVIFLSTGKFMSSADMVGAFGSPL